MRRWTWAFACAALLSASCVSAGLARSVTTLPGFRSPSQNISCLFVPGSGGGGSRLLCTIARSAYGTSLQARCMAPSGAGVDWHGFELTTRRAGGISCSGGILYNPATQHPKYVTLPYGKTWQRAGFTCLSRITGITCRNRSGHGLFISRAAWRGW